MTRGPGLTFTICGRTYPALELGEHDGDPFARLPLETGLVVGVVAWRDADELSLFLVGPLRESDGEIARSLLYQNHLRRQGSSGARCVVQMVCRARSRI